MKKHDFAIIGGDKRISLMAQILLEKGYSVISYHLADERIHPDHSVADSLKEAIAGAPVLLCGIPIAIHVPLPELQRLLRKNQRLFAGMIPADFRQTCEDRQIFCHDFMTDESFVMQNAVLTAEGALLEALSHKNTCLYKKKILITGYGRCGKILAHRAYGLMADITVCDRSEKELALASAFGFHTLTPGDLSHHLSEFEYIFHTAPERVFTKERLMALSPHCLLIDIASGKVGVDYEAAEILGRNALYCPGLPGKYAPSTCAEQMVSFVLTQLN